MKKLGAKKARRYGELRTAVQEQGDAAALSARFVKDIVNPAVHKHQLCMA